MYTNPTSPAVGQVVTGGTINQPIIMPGAGTPGSETAVPTITPALRGFPNYKFQPETDGAGLNTSLASPAYGPTINQQGLVLQVQVGDTVKYAHIALHDTPDVGVPRPLIGVAGAGTQTPQVPNWSSSTAYVSGNRVVAGGVIYSCILANTNHTPPNGTYWVLVPAATLTNEMIAIVNAAALVAQGSVELHNDLVQSVLTMGLLPSVPRVKDTVDYSQTYVGPSMMTPPNQPQQSDVSDYQFSKPISFTNATQSNRKHPWELEPGAELVKCNMFVGEKNPAPTWPWPSFGGGVTLNDYFDSGPYRVYLGGTAGRSAGSPDDTRSIRGTRPRSRTTRPRAGGSRRVTRTSETCGTGWDRTGTPRATSAYTSRERSRRAYDVYYDITTTVLVSGKYGWFTGGAGPVTAATTERYYTGAGWLRVSSDSNWLWEGCLPLGQGAIAFDSTGIGKFDWTGDINAPFSYRKPIYNFNLAGNAALIAGMAYFIDTGGCLFQTDGSTCQQVMVYGSGLNMNEGPFNAALIPDITWAAGHVNIEFDDADHRLYADLGDGSTYDGDGSLVMIDFRSATFQCKSKGRHRTDDRHRRDTAHEARVQHDRPLRRHQRRLRRGHGDPGVGQGRVRSRR